MTSISAPSVIKMIRHMTDALLFGLRRTQARAIEGQPYSGESSGKTFPPQGENSLKKPSFGIPF